MGPVMRACTSSVLYVDTNGYVDDTDSESAFRTVERMRLLKDEYLLHIDSNK